MSLYGIFYSRRVNHQFTRNGSFKRRSGSSASQGRRGKYPKPQWNTAFSPARHGIFVILQRHRRLPGGVRYLLDVLPEELYSVVQDSRIANDDKLALTKKIARKVDTLLGKLMSVGNATETRNRAAAFGRRWLDATQYLTMLEAKFPSPDCHFRASNALHRAWQESRSANVGKSKFVVYRDYARTLCHGLQRGQQKFQLPQRRSRGKHRSKVKGR